MDRSLIENYLGGADKIRNAIKGLSAKELNAFPVQGTWSIQQIVVHLLDSDLIASHRMKRIIAEEKPLLIGYDETRFAKTLAYENEPLEEVIQQFALGRAQMGRIFKTLPDESFERKGVHNERGFVTLGQLIGDYAHHVDHHLSFVQKKRALLGK